MAKVREPVWKSKMTNAELATALNWYHINRSDINARRYLYEYALKAIDTTLTVNDVSRWNFLVTEGWISRLLSNNIGLPNNIRRKHDALIRKLIHTTPNIEEKPKRPKSTEVISAPCDFGILGELENEIDLFINQECKPSFILFKYLTAKKVKKKDANDIKRWAKLEVKRYDEVLANGDMQLKEAYSNFSRPELKRLHKFYQSFYDDADKYIKSAKKSRKKVNGNGGSETQASLESHLESL